MQEWFHLLTFFHIFQFYLLLLIYSQKKLHLQSFVQDFGCSSVMFEYQLNMAETVGFAIVLLLLGRWIKRKVNFFERFFIPAPVIGGTLFSIILLIGHQTESFTFTFNNDIKNLLMIAFFTTVGFSASLKILKKGGIGVALFLLAATILVILQDIVGPVLAKALGIDPLLGLAAGSTFNRWTWNIRSIWTLS